MPYVSAVYSANRDPLSALGRLATRNADWNHCGLIVGNEVYEARIWYGVQPTPFEAWKERCPHHTVVQIECPYPELAYESARKKKGAGYDYWGALGVPWRAHWQDPARFWCAEFLEACLLAGGCNRWREDVFSISPQESYDHR